MKAAGQYLCFDAGGFLDRAARNGAADGKALEHPSNGVTQTQGQQVLQQGQLPESRVKRGECSHR